MALEILRASGIGPPKRVDILLVHGIFVGAWVWEPHFLPYLAAAGYNVHAVSLRGHGRSCGGDRLHASTLADYTADLADTVSSVGRPVVAVGHSMGGAVVQNAIRTGTRFAGAALMASVPPCGLMPANIAMMWTNPRLWRELSAMFTSGPRSADPGVLREGLFSDRIDEKTFERFAARVGKESAVIGFELQGMRPFAPMPWQAPPVFVLGGSEDRFIRQDDLWATAAWYGVKPTILPGLSHSIMLDPDWKRGADALLAWLETLEIAPAAGLAAHTG